MEKFDPINPYVSTITGRIVHLLNPSVDEISIEDIGHALSQICRYTGHTQHFYSVAQHCCYVSDNVSEPNRLWGLLHDASEAYLGDVNSPLKSLLPDYRVIEHRMMAVIAQKFGLDGSMPYEVKVVDTNMLFNEAEVLLPTVNIADWNIVGQKVEGFYLRPWHSYEAWVNFIHRFTVLTS